MTRILSIPHELFEEIASQLLVPDQAALAGTSKFFHELLTPVVWKEIELHHRGVHEGRIIWQLLEDLDETWVDDAEVSEEYPFGDYTRRSARRKYCQPVRNRKAWHAYGQVRKAKDRDGDLRDRDEGAPRATDNINRDTYQDGRVPLFLGVKAGLTSPSRWAGLASHVQSLCMSVAVDHEVSAVLEDLINLRSLQLVGLPLAEEWGGGTVPSANDAWVCLRYPAMRRLRLRGYFPASFVREIFTKNASGLTHLDIGLLAGPWDDKANAILREEEHQDEDSESEIDEDEREPWALHSPHWLSHDDPFALSLSSLTNLHLVKPYGSSGSYGNNFRNVPGGYDLAIYKEWAAILDGAAGTLKEAIFEHREAQEVGDTVGDGDPHPLPKRPHPPTTPELADTQFCEVVLRRLLVGGRQRFPHLQRLSLRGIRNREIKVLLEDITGDVIPGKGDVPSNEDRLQAAFPDCDIELFEPAYPVYVYAGYVYQSWPENRHEAGQDPGDGLLYNGSYYNDYCRRFGPDWRVGN